MLSTISRYPTIKLSSSDNIAADNVAATTDQASRDLPLISDRWVDWNDATIRSMMEKRSWPNNGGTTRKKIDSTRMIRVCLLDRMTVDHGESKATLNYMQRRCCCQLCRLNSEFPSNWICLSPLASTFALVSRLRIKFIRISYITNDIWKIL
jgi:hypothetical protein